MASFAAISNPSSAAAQKFNSTAPGSAGGFLSDITEVLNNKRSLTLPMIRRLHTGLGIPAEALIS